MGVHNRTEALLEASRLGLDRLSRQGESRGSAGAVGASVVVENARCMGRLPVELETSALTMGRASSKPASPDGSRIGLAPMFSSPSLPRAFTFASASRRVDRRHGRCTSWVCLRAIAQTLRESAGYESEIG